MSLGEQLFSSQRRPQKSVCEDSENSRLWSMGAKYLPTIKDQKASQRFQQKQNPLRKFKKEGGLPGAKKKKGS